MTTEWFVVGALSLNEVTRIFSRISINGTGCWEWTGTLDPAYPLMWFRGRTQRVHRVLFSWLVQPVPIGKYRHLGQLDHRCNSKSCCNPCHIQLVSQHDNTLRGAGPSAINSRKQFCIRGHELTPVRNGRRRDCKTCDSLRHIARLKGDNAARYREISRLAQQRYRAKLRP